MMWFRVLHLRGPTYLLQWAERHRLCILNGAVSADHQAGGQFTSFQSLGYSVIDYALITREHLPMVSHFSVDAQRVYSDHAVLHARLATPLERLPEQTTSQRSDLRSSRITEAQRDLCFEFVSWHGTCSLLVPGLYYSEQR